MDSHYRIAIFGSARIKEGDRTYREVYTVARGLAEAGFDVVTGGGIGTILEFFYALQLIQVTHVCRNYDTYRAEMT